MYEEIPQTTSSESLDSISDTKRNNAILSGFKKTPEEFSGDSFANCIPIEYTKTVSRKNLI